MKKKLILGTCLVAVWLSIAAFSADFNLQESVKRGKEVYINNCITCHMENGEGIPAVFPPLVNSDYLNTDKERAIHQTLFGASGTMVVNGITYNGVMLPSELNDQQAADVLNYIFQSWGNNGPVVKPEEVKKVRMLKEAK
jgi:nitrite reductase (NO-forming)